MERFEDEAGRLKQRISVLEYNRQNIKTEEAQAYAKLEEVKAQVLQKERRKGTQRNDFSFKQPQTAIQGGH